MIDRTSSRALRPISLPYPGATPAIESRKARRLGGNGPALWPLAAAAMGTTLAAANWEGWPMLALLAVPTVAAWAVRRSSLLASLYLAQMAICFGLTSLILRPEREPAVTAIVVLWATGLATGALLGGRANAHRGRRPADRRWGSPRWPHLVVAAGMIALQAGLVMSTQLGIRAQLTHGVTTPAGILGGLTTAGPVFTLVVVVTALGSGRRMAWGAAFALLQAAVLAMSGFRGAAAVFVIGIAVAAALVLPTDSPWRRPPRVMMGGSVLALVAVVGFILGANVKHDVAADMNAQSAGTQLFGVDDALPIVATRLDLGASLEKGVEFKDNYAADEAVSWKYQVQSVIPRFLWPEKPIIDYGQRISAVVYGMRYGKSSSTVTTIGDTLMNFDIIGVACCSLLLGFVLARLEAWVRRGPCLISLVLAAALAQIITNQETSLVLSFVGLLRNVLIAGLLWAVCQAAAIAAARARVRLAVRR